MFAGRSQDGCAAGTVTPAPSAPAPPPKVISQKFTFSGLSVNSYKGKVRDGYEKGFGKALGIVECSNGACKYRKGCSVTSTVTAGARRAGAAVTFAGTVSSTVYSATPIPAAGVTVNTLATEISSVAAQDDTVTIAQLPQASSMKASPPTITTAAGSSSSSSSSGLLFIIIGAGAALVIVVVVVAVVWHVKKSRTQDDGVNVHDSAIKGVIEEENELAKVSDSAITGVLVSEIELQGRV